MAGPYERPSGDRLGIVDDEVRAAFRFTVQVIVAAGVFLVVAALWVNGCAGAATDTVTCGKPERMVLVLGGPAILMVGGLRASVRTYQVWNREETWWGWHGAVWFLFTAMAGAVLAGYLPLADALR